MPRFTIDLSLDGYDTEEAMEKGCREFILEQLNITASYVEIIDDAVDAKAVLAKMSSVSEEFPLTINHQEDGRYAWPDRWHTLYRWLESKCDTS